MRRHVFAILNLSIILLGTGLSLALADPSPRDRAISDFIGRCYAENENKIRKAEAELGSIRSEQQEIWAELLKSKHGYIPSGGGYYGNVDEAELKKSRDLSTRLSALEQKFFNIKNNLPNDEFWLKLYSRASEYRSSRDVMKRMTDYTDDFLQNRDEAARFISSAIQEYTDLENELDKLLEPETELTRKQNKDIFESQKNEGYDDKEPEEYRRPRFVPGPSGVDLVPDGERNRHGNYGLMGQGSGGFGGGIGQVPGMGDKHFFPIFHPKLLQGSMPGEERPKKSFQELFDSLDNQSKEVYAMFDEASAQKHLNHTWSSWLANNLFRILQSTEDWETAKKYIPLSDEEPKKPSFPYPDQKYNPWDESLPPEIKKQFRDWEQYHNEKPKYDSARQTYGLYGAFPRSKEDAQSIADRLFKRFKKVFEIERRQNEIILEKREKESRTAILKTEQSVLSFLLAYPVDKLEKANCNLRTLSETKESMDNAATAHIVSAMNKFASTATLPAQNQCQSANSELRPATAPTVDCDAEIWKHIMRVRRMQDRWDREKYNGDIYRYEKEILQEMSADCRKLYQSGYRPKPKTK